MQRWYAMKKFYFIIFLLIVVIGVLGYAAKIENSYLDNSGVASSSLAEDIFSQDYREPVRLDYQNLITLGILLGTGLIGLIIIRRK